MSIPQSRSRKVLDQDEVPDSRRLREEPFSHSPREVLQVADSSSGPLSMSVLHRTQSMQQQFLARLLEDPADLTTWLVYADWLDEQDDPTGSFIRLSLDLTAGCYPAEDAEARVLGFEKLYATVHPETRDLLANYRCHLPTRFRVLSRSFSGEDPPREMFGYARTIAVGFLEAGRVVPGTNLGVGMHGDGRPRVVQAILTFNRDVIEMAAGCEPIQAALGWLGHLQIEPGSVLAEVPKVLQRRE